MSEAFETDIKKYTEQIARDPNSRSYFPLSDIYRKLGQYDEAIALAKEGLSRHENYLGGKTVLARAHFENGDLDPAQQLLESILVFAADNLLANRLLAQIYVQKGESHRAEPILRRLVAMDPFDEKTAEQLAQLVAQNKKAMPATPSKVSPSSKVGSDAASTAAATMKTATLANMYRNQGHLQQSLGIYQELQRSDPKNPMYGKAIADLEKEIGMQRNVQANISPKISRLGLILSRIQERRRVM